MVMSAKPSTTPAPPGPAPGPEGPTAGQVAARRWRASRGVLFAVLAMVVVAIALSALRPSGSAQDLDPESAGPGGTRALAEIIRQRGTPVQVARRAADAAGQATAGKVLVITRPDRLTDTDLTLLRGTRADLLLVDPSREVLAGLAPGIQRAAGSFEPASRPGCSLRGVQMAGQVEFGTSTTYELGPGAVGCYHTEDGLYRLAQIPAGGRTVTVLGSAQPLTNEKLRDEGNAALGMNLADARAGVVWLIPDPPAPGSGSEEESLGGLLPFGVRLFILQLIIAVLVIALWRARRLGPVVAENLPVIVRSAETVEGRARLYRSHRARGSAADALRSGTRERLVPLLGLPRSAAQDPAAATEIVAAVAQRSDHDEAMVGAALYGPEPGDDGQLVGLTDLLDDLERQVRHS